MTHRYGSWQGGPDPLEPPVDVAAALDRLGDRVLAGDRPGRALAGLLRQGLPGLRGLRSLQAEVRRRRRALRSRGQLSGTLDEVRRLLDEALDLERRELLADPSGEAQLAGMELDQLPEDTAGAVRRLADYRWRSLEAEATYERIRDLLRREVLDTSFRGLREALHGASPEALARVRDMLTELNELLDADARGQDTTAAFDRFMRRYGDLFPERPRNLEELVDVLARRAAAASRMLASLTPEQRAELLGLAEQAMGELGMGSELARLGAALRARRPELSWGQSGAVGGDVPLGLGDATSALQELADLEALERQLGQGYPGASLDDVDLDALERALGRRAVEDVDALRDLERELAEQGFLERERGRLRLTPKALRRIGARALRRVFERMDALGRGEHDVAAAGLAGEPTGSSRPWRFGDEQPVDVVRTLNNAVLRTAERGRRGQGLALEAADFEVLDTERRSAAAVCLLVDLSYSMLLRDAWGAAKATTLALHSLISTRFPQDRLQLVGFSSLARVLRPADVPELEPDMVQGTNLQHALRLASRYLDRHRDAEPVVLVVTDGEPTAHLEADGEPRFAWPPVERTVELTLAEVLRLTRRGAAINVFMLDEEPRLVRFVHAMARLNGGRVLSPATERLGDYVVSDYLRARRGRT